MILGDGKHYSKRKANTMSATKRDRTKIDEIIEGWDPSGQITAKSDPQAEFDRWVEFTLTAGPDWNPHQFTLEDFTDYIDLLREMEVAK